MFVSFNTDITSSQRGHGVQQGIELERTRGYRREQRREEERRPCLKRAVEINQYVYVPEEQSVPLAEEHSTVRFPSDCFYRTPSGLCACMCV